MATDTNDIPSGLLRTLARGLETEQPSEFLANDLVTLREDVDTLSGDMPVRPSKHTVRRDENRDLSEGAEAKSHDGNLSTVSYDTARQVGFEYISNGQIIEGDAYNEDEIENALQGAEAESNLYIDINLESLLTGSTPQTVSAQANYSNHSGAEPFTDLDNAFDNSPGASTLVMGKTVFTELSQLPDITARASNFDAGGVGEDELENILLNRYAPRGLEEVHVMRKFYDTNNEGQSSVSKSWIMDTSMALYHRDAVQVVRPEHRLNPNVDQDANIRRSGVEVVYEQRTDDLITTSDKVVKFTGI